MDRPSSRGLGMPGGAPMGAGQRPGSAANRAGMLFET